MADPIAGTVDDPIVGVVDAKIYRAAGYGPNAGDPPTHDTTYGPLGQLGENDLAVSPNMLAEYPIGSRADIVDPKTGRVIYPNQRVADYSYTSPGHPNHNEFEQRHVQDMGHMGLRPHVDTPDNNPVVGRVDGLSDTPEGAIQQPDNNPVVGLIDLDKRKPKFAGVSKEEVQTAEEPQPVDIPRAIGDFWTNLFGKATETGSGLDVAKAKEDLNRAESGEPKDTLFGLEKEKEDQELKNPNISQADAEEIIERRRERTEMDAQVAQKQLERAQNAQATAKEMTPGPEYQRTIPGVISGFLGQAAPYLLSGSLGAAAPFGIATQMSEQAYGDTFERNMEQGQKAHPEWSEEQLRQNADWSARGAAQTGFENGVVMGLLPVPKVGPLIAQLVERIGMRGAYMTIAGASQDIEENIQVKKLDPKQAIYEGVLAHAPANFIAGGAFELPGAIVEATGRPNAATPGAQETPEAQPRVETAPQPQQEPQPRVETAPKPEPEPEKITAAANRYSNGRVFTGTDHGEAASKAERSGEPLAQINPETGAPGEYPEEGFVTNTGRFVNRDEAHRVATGSEGNLTAEQLQPAEEQKTKPEQVPQQLDEERSAKLDLLGLADNKTNRAIASLAVKYDKAGIEKFVVSAGKDDNGNIITSEFGHGTVAKEFWKRGINPDDVRYGFLTNKGRFVRATENVNLSGEVADVRDQARAERRQQLQRLRENPPTPEPAPVETKPEQTPEDTDKWVSAIANRYSQERSAQGEIGEIAPGEGYSSTDLLNRGLRMSPEQINQHISDLMHDTGNPKLQAAAIRAEEARLSQRSSQLSRAADDNPGDPQARAAADDAFNDLTDFHNGPVAKLKNNWHAQGMSLQGEIPVDLSTFNGLREAWLRDVGTRPPKSVEMTMRNTATRVRAAVEVENAAMNRLGREVDKAPARGLSAEDVEAKILARMKDLPCRT